MLATIDEETEAKVDRDRQVHGVGITCVLPDGRIVHVPAEEVLPHLGDGIRERMRRRPLTCTYRIAKVIE